MNTSLEAKTEAWQRFVDQGIIDPSVPYSIAESWKRCKAMAVDFQDGTGKKIESQRLKEVLEKNKVLLEIARPIMKNLLNIVLESHFAIFLTDQHGYVLESFGDNIVRDRADNIRFIPGTLWTEAAVGTNAIGTALAIDQPIQVVGAEHYCMPHHLWTCSAAPIHGVDGQLVGCLNMSGDYREAHSHTLGIVVAGAFSIEKQLALLHSYEMVEATFESTSDGMILTDRQLNIQKINEGALRMLGIQREEAKRLSFYSLFRELNFDSLNELFEKRKTAYFTDFNIYYENKRIPCTISMVPIIIDNEITGFSLGFEAIKHLHKTVNKVTGNVATYTFQHILTEDQAMQELIHLGKRLAVNKGCILIEGESGTGKELFAHAIHNASPRAKGPFVAVNCASLPRELIESELFGYEKGAFTGALKEGNPGKFELAEGGTLFLDEIGELPLELQAKLLRVVEYLKVRRIGGNYEKNLDVRIIAATNRNLLEEVEKKNFREDLYFRLNVFKLEIPPLRRRPRDIICCAEAFLDRLNREHPEYSKSFSDGFLHCLVSYSWPGNVRELQNSIERAYFLCEEAEISPIYFSNIRQVAASPAEDSRLVSLDNALKNNIEVVLRDCKGDVFEAARRLNMSRASLYRRIKKYDILLTEIKKN